MLPDLLPVDGALERILAQVFILNSEDVLVPDALWRVLAEDVFSSIDVPPFANSSMDGYAVIAGDLKMATWENSVRLRVLDDIPAGVTSRRRLNCGEAARIMTGAPLPPGADAVIPVEDTSANWRGDHMPSLVPEVEVFRAVEPYDFTRQPGEDIRQGEIILRHGVVLRPQDLGVLVSIGLSRVAVRRRPSVAILASDDELVDFDSKLKGTLSSGQLHNSNSIVLAGLVSAVGGVPYRIPVSEMKSVLSDSGFPKR